MSGEGWRDRWRHAFAVDDPDAFEPTEREREVATRVCREVVRRRMTTPALMFLEMSRPLNYVGAQVLHFFRPFGGVLVDPGAWDDFAAFVERRGSIEFLCRQLEAEAAEPTTPDADSTVESEPTAGVDPPSDGRSEPDVTERDGASG